MDDSLRIGLQLTVFGMGLVFLLLALLWGVMTLLLRLDRGSEEPRSNQLAVPPGALATTPGVTPEPEMLAAITVAVLMHRSVRRKQAAPAMRAHQPGTLPSRWVGAGRTRQNQSWHPHRRA